MKRIIFTLILGLSITTMAETKTRQFDANKNPLPLGKAGAYSLVCSNDAEWNNSGCPDNTVLVDGVVRFKTDAEKQATLLTAKQTAILAQSNFSKLEIRRAMRALEQETVLDSLLASNATFAKDWADADKGINLNDPLVIQALATVNVNVNTIKLKILELK